MKSSNGMDEAMSHKYKTIANGQERAVITATDMNGQRYEWSKTGLTCLEND